MATPTKPLTKSEIIAELAEHNGMTKKQVVAFLESLNDLAYREAKKKEKFLLPGFGFLKLVKRPARMGRNPATGETIKIPAKKVVKFVLAKACKDAVLPPAAKK